MVPEDPKKDLELLISSFREVPVVDMGGYQYFVHPLSDGIPAIDPDVIMAATRLIVPHLPPIWSFDLIVTAEAMGIPIATSLSMKTGKPISIIRKRSYGIKGEAVLGQSTGYSENRLYMNLPDGPGGKVLIVDDVLSTGGTLKAIVEGIRACGREVAKCIILFNKMNGSEKEELEKELSIEICTLLDIEVADGRCTARKSRD